MDTTPPPAPSYWYCGEGASWEFVIKVVHVLTPPGKCSLKTPYIKYEMLFLPNWESEALGCMYGIEAWENYKKLKKLVQITEDQFKCLKGITGSDRPKRF